MKHRRKWLDVNPVVFFVSAGAMLAFVVFGAIAPDFAGDVFGQLQAFIVDTFGWFYVLSATIFLVFVLYLLFSRYGNIRLGDDSSKPEFKNASWFAMLFSAGMGIGLVFWGVAEPIFHYMGPPVGAGETPEAMTQAMRYTFYHWGLHPWAIYIVLGLSIAYFHYRHKLPLAPRSIFYPLLGERINGPIGHGIDILAVVATLFGIATSLGLGATQINTGLSVVAGVPEGTGSQLLIIAVITLIATISVVTGVKKGVKLLSETNLVMAGLLLLFLLVFGPTVFLLELFVTSVGDYFQNLLQLSFWTDAGDRTEGWLASWTLFYWGWWISWAPFVGVFIARISKGRTIREFILGVLLVPTGMTFLWLTVFGGTGLHIDLFGDGGIAAATTENVTLSLYAVLDQLPLTLLTSLIATVLVAVFFITSSDSGSLVIDMITAGGKTGAPKVQRVFWAVTEGAIAAVLLLAGGLEALQTASITAGLPMAVLMLVMCLTLLKALRVEAVTEGVPSREHLVAGAEAFATRPRTTGD